MASLFLKNAFLSALCGICACTSDFNVDAPLFLYSTYPANGTTVSTEALTEIDLTFSEDLGGMGFIQRWAKDLVVLESPEGLSIELVHDDFSNVDYNRDTFTLTIFLDALQQATLPKGNYTLRVLRSFATDEGVQLPADYTVRFILSEN